MTVLVAPPAPSYRVHPPAIVTVEYPGPVASSSKSQLKAVDTLGGIQRLTKALDNPHGIVELNFRPKEPFSHTVPGDTVRTKNMVVVKVIKRRRKRRKTKIVGHEVLDDVGVYKVESVGTVEKVVRFRSMADLQYQAEGYKHDETVNVANAMRNMDVEAISQFNFPEPSENFEDGLRLLPPPVFSRISLPQIYNYRPNPLSASVTTTTSDGAEVTRLINRTKYKGELVQAVPWSTPKDNIPSGPSTSLEEKRNKLGLEKPLLEKIAKLFEERPVWTRAALTNQLTKAEGAKVTGQKVTLPYTCWTFSDGPFRELCIRFGYDPREDPQARFYQKVMLRNMLNTKFYLKKLGGERALEGRELMSDEQSHIFDGQMVHRNIGNFQLIDVTDPYLMPKIRESPYVRETCDYVDGWWDGEFFEFIRQVIRRKFFALVNEGKTLPDEDFADLEQHLEAWHSQQVEAKEREEFADVDGSDAVAEEGEDKASSPAPEQQKKLTSLKNRAKKGLKPRPKVSEHQVDLLRTRQPQTVEPTSVEEWAATNAAKAARAQMSPSAIPEGGEDPAADAMQED